MTPVEKVNAAAQTTIVTVNAIYTVDPKVFYPRKFPEAMMRNLFATYPSCQCVHVDTGAEARATLIAIGKHVRNE